MFLPNFAFVKIRLKFHNADYLSKFCLNKKTKKNCFFFLKKQREKVKSCPQHGFIYQPSHMSTVRADISFVYWKINFSKKRVTFSHPRAGTVYKLSFSTMESSCGQIHLKGNICLVQVNPIVNNVTWTVEWGVNAVKV